MHATSLGYVAPAVPARRCHSAHHDQGQKLAKEQVREEVISRLTKHPWRARSPDLSPLDFWFWSVAMTELKGKKTLVELKETIESLVNGRISQTGGTGYPQPNSRVSGA